MEDPILHTEESALPIAGRTNKVIGKNMTNNSRVEWFLNGEIQSGCESCKFPRHDGPCGSAYADLLPCGSASSFLNEDEIVTLNIGCEYCREEFSRDYRLLRESSFPVKLTYEERKPVFDSLHQDDLENTCLFKGIKGLPDVNSRMVFFHSIQWEATSIDADEFKRQLKDSILIMSSSGQDLWKTMFGNVEESIHLLWTLRCVSSHLFSHQMAYFLSAIDIGDKASFLGRGEIHCIPHGIRPMDMYMLIPSIGFHRIKAMIMNATAKKNTDALVPAFLLFVVKNQRELEQAGELDKDQVGELACRFGVQYVHASSHPYMFSLDGFCPLGIMEIRPLNSSSRFKLNSSSRFKLQPQNVRASAQLVHQIEVHSQNIEVSINVRNVRCHILSDIAFDQEKYFPSRIQIRVIPSKDCEKRTQVLTVGKSGNDAPRTLSREEQWESGIKLPTTTTYTNWRFGPRDLKARVNFGSSRTHTSWRFEMDECLDNSSAGYFEWTLFDNANGVEVWSADCRNYNKLMHRGSSLRNRGSHLSSPFTRDGGCVFSEDLYGQPLTWSFDKRVAGTTSSWMVEMGVWLTYCYNVSRNYCFQTASWSFTESLEMKL